MHTSDFPSRLNEFQLSPSKTKLKRLLNMLQNNCTRWHSFCPDHAIELWWSDCSTTRRVNQQPKKEYRPQNPDPTQEEQEEQLTLGLWDEWWFHESDSGKESDWLTETHLQFWDRVCTYNNTLLKCMVVTNDSPWSYKFSILSLRIIIHSQPMVQGNLHDNCNIFKHPQNWCLKKILGPGWESNPRNFSGTYFSLSLSNTLTYTSICCCSQ